MTIMWPTPVREDYELARKYGYTPHLIARFRQFIDDLEEFLIAMETYKRKFIRINTINASPKEVRKDLEDKGFKLRSTPISYVFEVLKEPFSISSTPEYLRGEFYIQDLSSIIPPIILEPEPEELILDLAAAPGGKTTHIAQLTGDKAKIIAVDISRERMKAMRSNVNRLGLRSIIMVRRDGRKLPEMRLKFDKILLDAPCTGEGVIPRDPTRKRIRKEEYKTRVAIQRDLIKAAYKVLKEGGVLVYSTCTFSPEENEHIIEYVLENLEMELMPIKFDMIKLDDGIGLKGVARSFPHKQHMLGAFYAKLRKT